MELSPALYAFLERFHGHLALLGLALLLHPVVTLSRRKGLGGYTLLSAELGAALLVAPFAVGWLIYPTYRTQVKPGLVSEQLAVALRFETKEHLAAMAVALAISGAITLRAAGRTAVGRRAARDQLLFAWVLGAGAGGIGLFVSAMAHLGW